MWSSRRNRSIDRSDSQGSLTGSLLWQRSKSLPPQRRDRHRNIVAIQIKKEELIDSHYSSSNNNTTTAAAAAATVPDVITSNNNTNDDIDGEKTMDELHETISHLKSSLLSHATSNIQTTEHFTTLQLAHDTLYNEHTHLQEQMDDAVELLKYLKEEKGTYESTISELRSNIDIARGEAEECVVSMTIENLTKDKMELEMKLKDMGMEEVDALKQEREGLLQQIDILEKEMEEKNAAVDSSSKSVQDLKGITKERDELQQQVQTLQEQSSTLLHTAEKENAIKDALETKLQSALQELKNNGTTAESKFVTLQSQHDKLLQSNTDIQSQLHTLEVQCESKDDEMKALKVQLDTSLEKIVQLQRSNSNSSSNSSTTIPSSSNQQQQQQHPLSLSNNDMVDREEEEENNHNPNIALLEDKAVLENENQTLQEELDNMRVYVKSLEDMVVTKDELLGTCMNIYTACVRCVKKKCAWALCIPPQSESECMIREFVCLVAAYQHCSVTFIHYTDFF